MTASSVLKGSLALLKMKGLVNIIWRWWVPAVCLQVQDMKTGTNLVLGSQNGVPLGTKHATGKATRLGTRDPDDATGIVLGDAMKDFSSITDSDPVHPSSCNYGLNKSTTTAFYRHRLT